MKKMVRKPVEAVKVEALQLRVIKVKTAIKAGGVRRHTGGG